MPKKVTTEKQKQKDAIKALFPISVETMEKILKDELKDKRGLKVKVTGKMRLDVAMRVMDQVIGRPAQAVTVGGDAELPPIRTLEVRKTYVNRDDAPTETVDPKLTSVGPRPDNIPQAHDHDTATRAAWLKQIEEEAMANT